MQVEKKLEIFTNVRQDIHAKDELIDKLRKKVTEIELNLKEKDLDKSKQYSIHSVTEVKSNAVLGTINLSICIKNVDESSKN